MSAPASIALIVAAADNGVIGRDNALPWHLPDDLKRFKQLTLGKPVVMGRKTFESIGRPLPGRRNIVLTRDPSYLRDGIEVVHDVEGALRAAADAPEIAIIGGADVFRLFLPRATRVYLTRVHCKPEGNVFWDELDDSEWRMVQREEHAADERHAYPMAFELLERASRA